MLDGTDLEEVDFEDPDLAAMLVSVDWHFSCCFLNSDNLSCSDAIQR